MNMIFCVIAVAIAVSAAAAVILLPGKLKRLVSGTGRVTAIVDGEDAALERTLRALLRAQRSAEFEMTVLVSEQGMSEENKRIAEIAARENPEIILCDPEKMSLAAERYICRKYQMSQSNMSSLREG